MLRINIETKDRKELRYNTAGDYYEKDGVWHIEIAELGDWKKEFLLAIHELVEKALCKKFGIPDSVIDDFDKSSDRDEPGEDPKCPYREMHFTAETVERLMADLMGIDWIEYCESLEGKE
jgi:hypothetical protein